MRALALAVAVLLVGAGTILAGQLIGKGVKAPRGWSAGAMTGTVAALSTPGLNYGGVGEISTSAHIRGAVKEGTTRPARSDPRLAELMALEKKIEEAKSRWREYVDSSILTEEEITRHYGDLKASLDELGSDPGREASEEISRKVLMFQESLKEFERKTWQDVEESIAAKEQELQSKLDDDFYAEEARMNGALDRFRESIQNQYYPVMVSLQFKLKTLQLSDAEKRKLESELTLLRNEMNKKIAVREDEERAKYTAYAEARKAGYEQALLAYKNSLLKSAEDRIALEKGRLETELGARILARENELREDARQQREALIEETNRKLEARRWELGEKMRSEEEEFLAELRALEKKRDELRKEIQKEI